MRNLIFGCQRLTEIHHFESLVHTIASVVQQHQTNKLIQMAALGAIVALREKNRFLTVKAVVEGQLNQV